MTEWASTAPDEVELDVLEAADDVWATPAEDDPSTSIEHLAALWSALGGIGRLPWPGQIAWFSLTAAGQARLAAEVD